MKVIGTISTVIVSRKSIVKFHAGSELDERDEH